MDVALRLHKKVTRRQKEERWLWIAAYCFLAAAILLLLYWAFGLYDVAGYQDGVVWLDPPDGHQALVIERGGWPQGRIATVYWVDGEDIYSRDYNIGRLYSKPVRLYQW